LYELQQTDTALDALKKQYAAMDKGQTERATYDAAKAAHQAAAAALKATHATQTDIELEQKSVENKRAEFETRLYSGKVTNPKELQAMQDEVEMLARNRSRLDEKLILVMDELETQTRVEAEAKKALSVATSVLKKKAAAVEAEKNTLVAQYKLLETQRHAAAKEADPALLKRYDNFRATRGNPAKAPIVDGNACGGCRMALPSNLVGQVHRGEGIQVCQNCGRLLCELAKT
jgi:predicted  nucleic acid-binding Zn-ribbon protein